MDDCVEEPVAMGGDETAFLVADAYEGTEVAALVLSDDWFES